MHMSNHIDLFVVVISYPLYHTRTSFGLTSPMFDAFETVLYCFIGWQTVMLLVGKSTLTLRADLMGSIDREGEVATSVTVLLHVVKKENRGQLFIGWEIRNFLDVSGWSPRN